MIALAESSEGEVRRTALRFARAHRERLSQHFRDRLRAFDDLETEDA